MSIATDMGGLPVIGNLNRYNPGRQIYPLSPGLSYYWPGPYNKPNAWEWTTSLNAASAVNALDRMVMTMPNPANKFCGLVAPGGILPRPYTIEITVAHSSMAVAAANGNACFGIFLFDGTKIIEFSIGEVNLQYTSVIETWTNANTFSANVQVLPTALARGLYALRICDDGVNRTYRQSSNGKDYLLHFTEATNTFLTPTNWGVGGIQNPPAGVAAAKGHVYHAAIVPGILGDLP